MKERINFLGDITIFVSVDHIIRNVNKSIFNLLLYTEEQLIGKPIQQILPTYDFELLNSQNYIPITDTEIVNQNGVKIPISVSSSAIRDNQHNLIGIWMLLNVIEEIHPDGISLKDLEFRYRALTENALDAVIVMNAEGIVIEWNRRAEIDFGWLEHEAVGQRLADLIIPSEYREHHKRGLAHFVKTGEGRILNKRMELIALNREGQEFPVELTVTPIKWGKTYLFSAYVRNITERKTAEKELIVAKEKAEAGAKAKSEFLATISHEIRTPLNGIMGMSSLLKDTDLTEEQGELVEYLVNSGSVLFTVINDVLDYSRIESGHVDLNDDPFELKACIAETVDLLSGLIDEKKLGISYFVDPMIPTILMGDPGRIRQVLINLVGNAIKFTHEGSIHIDARLLTDQEDEIKLKLSVFDSGIGVQKEFAEKLFEPFYQSDSSNTRKYGGTGLGLAISKKLVQQMGGEIWLEQTSEEGATFSFFIVVNKGINEDRIDKRNPEEQETHPFADMKILIAEDNVINQKVLLKMLEKLGYQADIANTGVEVLEYLQQNEYKLIFMDIQMPEMDGIEATKQIHRLMQSDKRPTIIAVTANAFQSDKERYLAEGADGYISKPIRIQQLREVLNALRKGN